MGGTTFVARQELVRQPDVKRVHISFQIPVRHIEWSSVVPGEDPSSSMIPMVSIAAVGGEAPIWTTYERLAVDFSYFRIKQLQVRESNVIQTTERLCRLNRQDRV